MRFDATGAVYSLHKSSTRAGILRRAAAWSQDKEEGGCNVETRVVAELRWQLPRTFAHQKKAAHDIAVDLICFVKK